MATLISRLPIRPLSSLCQRWSSKRMLLNNHIYQVLPCTPQLMAYKSNSTDKGHILTHSTLFVQDGLDIQELPLVIKRVDGSRFPFVKASYSWEELHEIASREKAFQLQLMDCFTVTDVFKLLEVPGDGVNSRSAALALGRICKLQQGTTPDIETYMCKIILQELCDIVLADMETLENDLVIDLVQCGLKSFVPCARFIEEVYEEVEDRIGTGRFFIPELCSLIEILSSHAKGNQTVANNVWIHLSNRFTEIDEKSIVTVYKVCQYISPNQKYMWNVLDKRLQKVWWHLNSSDVSVILKRVTEGNYYSGALMSALGKWSHLNIHKVSDNEMQNILNAYKHFNFTDEHFMGALERYVSVRAQRMNKTLVAMAMDYCHQHSFISVKIFEAVASDFEKNGTKYDALEFFLTLRPFGKLNYVPSNHRKLFAVAEEILTKKCLEFDAATLIELLVSFVYLERFPFNFLRKILTPHFISKIKAIPNIERRQRAGKNLLEIKAALKIEFPKYAPILLDEHSLGLTLTFMADNHWRFHQNMLYVLTDILGTRGFKDIEVPRSTPHLIDFEILRYNPHAEPLKLAIIGIMPEYYCSNAKHLLGEHSTRIRHLKKMGYTVIEISYETYIWKMTGHQKRKEYLERRLEPFMKLPRRSTIESPE